MSDDPKADLSIEKQLLTNFQLLNVKTIEIKTVLLKATDLLTQAVGAMTNQAKSLAAPAASKPDKAPEPKQESPGKPGMMGDAQAGMAEVGGMYGQIAAQIQGVAGKIVGALQDISQKAMHFVSFLNPSLVQMFDRAMKDLNATFGVAMTGIVQASIEYVRLLGSVLLPVMRQLEPIITRLSSAFMQLMQAGVGNASRLLNGVIQVADALVKMVESMMPAIDALQAIGKINVEFWMSAFQNTAHAMELLAGPIETIAELFAGLTPIFEAMAMHVAGVMAVFRALMSALFSMIPGMSIDTKGFRTAMETLSKYALLAGAHLAKLLGYQAEYIKGIRDSLQDAKLESNQGLSASQNTAYTSFAEFGRNIALEASKSQGGSPALTKDQKDEAFQKGILEELTKMENGQEDALSKAVSRLISEGKTMLKEELLRLAENLKADVKATGQGLLDDAKDRFRRKIVNPVRDIFG